MTISRLTLVSCAALSAVLCFTSFAKECTLHKPKYAKLVLSKDGSKVLPIAIDTTSKETDKYTVLYVDEKCNGDFTKPKKIPGRTKHTYNILNAVLFSTVKLPPLYDKDAEGKTEVNIAHWCNQRRIWDRNEDKRERVLRRARAENARFVDTSPQQKLYATVQYDIRQGSTLWEYAIRRAISTSTSLKDAPGFDFTVKPQLRLVLVPAKRAKSKRGVLVFLEYCGSMSIEDSRFIDNLVSWEEDGRQSEVDIVVKKPDGTQVNSYKKPLSKLRLTRTGGMSDRKLEKAETAMFLVHVPKGGGTVEATLDMGPMFGVQKASETVE